VRYRYPHAVHSDERLPTPCQPTQQQTPTAGPQQQQQHHSSSSSSSHCNLPHAACIPASDLRLVPIATCSIQVQVVRTLCNPYSCYKAPTVGSIMQLLCFVTALPATYEQQAQLCSCYVSHSPASNMNSRPSFAAAMFRHSPASNLHSSFAAASWTPGVGRLLLLSLQQHHLMFMLGKQGESRRDSRLQVIQNVSKPVVPESAGSKPVVPESAGKDSRAVCVQQTRSSLSALALHSACWVKTACCCSVTHAL
jgi:hypothetical protein